jgi:cell division protein FtsI (penicillin-binding protein 3)
MRRVAAGGRRSREGSMAVVLRRRFLLGFWVLCGAGLLWKCVELQVLQGAEWRAEAERQHRTTGVVPAPRGSVLDRSGVPLAISHEVFRVSVAPHEVVDTAGTVEALMDFLDLRRVEAQRPFSSGSRWVPLRGRHPPSAREALSGMRGVYVERELQRFYPHGELMKGVVGTVIDEAGAGGIEQAFDGHLRGEAGSEVLARDPQGRPIPGQAWLVQAPRGGGQVVLTLDADLQEIAREALREALEETGARGGDVIVSDPRTGEILAMVSIKDGQVSHLGGINTPYEPGSTLKPFTVATLLSSGKAAMTDSVDTGPGFWRVAGRTITDVHSPGRADLTHVLRVSSNVGIAKLAQRLTPAEQYEGLRDFGFGVPSGIQLPGEVGGRLTRPDRWSSQSPASLAIGYEIGTTPLQMAMAYGSLANGGTLMEPRIVREIRDPAGRALERFEPRAVRRVVSPEVASEVNRALVGAVEDGTGTRARLATFAVAGKSGTSRVHGPGGYEPGAYYASFVGFFPAEDPQLVVFVKLDRPQGPYYGGATAAPVTRATMEAILAAHAPPVDRRALAAMARRQAASVQGSGVTAIPVRRDGSAPTPGSQARIEGAPVPAFASRNGPGPTSSSPLIDRGGEPVEGGVLLPDLRGLAPRTAVRRLHGLGLVASWESAGAVRSTDPSPGSVVLAGDTVRIFGGDARPVPPGGTGNE